LPGSQPWMDSIRKVADQPAVIKVCGKTRNHNRLRRIRHAAFSCAYSPLIACLTAGWICSIEPASCQKTQDTTGPKLSGTAVIDDLAAEIISVRAGPPGAPRRDRLTCFEIRIRNNSASVVTLDGDRAQAEIDGEPAVAISSSQFQKSLKHPLNTGGRLLVAAVAAGSLGLAGPVFSEFLTDPYHRLILKKRPEDIYAQAFGRDQLRLRAEALRIGKRMLLPGDETTGWACFNLAGDLTPRRILIPIATGAAGTITGLLTVDLGANKQLPSTSGNKQETRPERSTR